MGIETELSPFAWLVLSADSHVLHVSPSFTDLLGYNVDEFLHRQCTARHKLLADTRATSTDATVTDYTYVVELPHKKGHLVQLRLCGNTVQLYGATIRIFTCTAMAHRGLGCRSGVPVELGRYDALNAVVDGIAIFYTDGTVQPLNAAAEKLCAAVDGDWIGAAIDLDGNRLHPSANPLLIAANQRRPLLDIVLGFTASNITHARFVRGNIIPLTSADSSLAPTILMSFRLIAGQVESDSKAGASADKLLLAHTREIYHRVQNNLQGVANLLQNFEVTSPQYGRYFRQATEHVLAIATVYGLEAKADNAFVALEALIVNLTQMVARFHDRALRMLPAEGCETMALAPRYSVAVALAVTELLDNAFTHSAASSVVELSIMCDPDWPGNVLLCIRNASEPPLLFQDLQQLRRGRGLRLVKALLPSEYVKFNLHTEGSNVIATLSFMPPVVRSGI